jgi:type IV pilus assembly protein PilQ
MPHPPSFAQEEEPTFADEYLYPEFNKTISMDFLDARLNQVLKILSQQSGMNFVASDAIKDKNVNVYLSNVKVWEALERILETNNLTYEMRPNSNVFLVKELVQQETQMITRVYELKHIPVPSHLINSMLSFDDEIGESEAGGGAGATGAGGTTATSVTTTSEDEGIVGVIQSVLSEDGSVVEDKRTNSLIVTDYPTQFPIIEATIARLDVRVPQILIEAEMLDISKNAADRLGANFSGRFFDLFGGEKATIWPFDDSDKQAFAVSNTYAPGLISFQQMEMFIEFLREDTETKNLARPRILTLNNQTATIAIKTDEAIGLVVQQGTEGSVGDTTEAERAETGVFLKVTPQANTQTREIMMAVEPKVVQARASAIQGFRDPEERGTKSILRVLDGDTIILGGLLRTDETDIRTSLPVISKVPVVGAAFRHKDKTAIQRELLVFLTPHIVEGHVKNQRMVSNSNYQREQDMPTGGRWDAVNKDMMYMER